MKPVINNALARGALLQSKQYAGGSASWKKQSKKIIDKMKKVWDDLISEVIKALCLIFADTYCSLD